MPHVYIIFEAERYCGAVLLIWSMWEVLTYKVAPAPWIEPKQRGCPRIRSLPDPTVPKRPRGRPRKVA